MGSNNLDSKEKELLDNILSNNQIEQDGVDMGGFSDVGIVVEPASGFFVLLDLSKILGKSYKGFTVSDDKTLLQFLYTSENIKVLTGNAFCWTDNQQLIIRTTTALTYSELADGFLRLKKAFSQLE